MGNCAGKPKTKEPVVSNKIQTPSKPAQETVVKQTPVKPAVKASENFPAKPKEDEKQIAAARGPRPDITVEAKKPNVQTVKFASCTTSGICSDVSEMCSAQVENIATKATVEIVPETVTEKLESFADDIAATEQIQKTSVADSFDEEQENYSNLKTGIDNVLQTDDFNDFIDTFTDKSKDIDVNVQTCSGAQESEITADFCEETLIKPIQRELSQDLEGSRIEGKTLSDYKASLAETKTDIEDFCGDIAVKTEEKLSKTSDFIQVENESSDFIQEDIIQPVMRQHSLETNQIEGKTLADYKASMNAVKDEFHEDFAETIEEIRKSQEMLDQLCSDMLPKKSDEVFEIPDKMSREESTTDMSEKMEESKINQENVVHSAEFDDVIQENTDLGDSYENLESTVQDVIEKVESMEFEIDQLVEKTQKIEPELTQKFISLESAQEQSGFVVLEHEELEDEFQKMEKFGSNEIKSEIEAEIDEKSSEKIAVSPKTSENYLTKSSDSEVSIKDEESLQNKRMDELDSIAYSAKIDEQNNFTQEIDQKCEDCELEKAEISNKYTENGAFFQTEDCEATNTVEYDPRSLNPERFLPTEDCVATNIIEYDPQNSTPEPKSENCVATNTVEYDLRNLTPEPKCEDCESEKAEIPVIKTMIDSNEEIADIEKFVNDSLEDFTRKPKEYSYESLSEPSEESQSEEVDVISENGSDLEDVSDFENDPTRLPEAESGRKNSDEILFAPDPIQAPITPQLRPDEPMPTANTPSVISETPTQKFFPESPVNFDSPIESRSPVNRSPAESEPGDAMYDYVEKDMEPGDDLDELIEMNRNIKETGNSFGSTDNLPSEKLIKESVQEAKNLNEKYSVSVEDVTTTKGQTRVEVDLADKSPRIMKKTITKTNSYSAESKEGPNVDSADSVDFDC